MGDPQRQAIEGIVNTSFGSFWKQRRYKYKQVEKLPFLTTIFLAVFGRRSGTAFGGGVRIPWGPRYEGMVANR